MLGQGARDDTMTVRRVIGLTWFEEGSDEDRNVNRMLVEILSNVATLI